MCGRYVTPEEADFERYWGLTHHQATLFLAGYVQSFNVAPTMRVPIIFLEDGKLAATLARWGLIPFWWSKPKPPPFTFNTRIEEAATKPMWRQPLKESRCLVPALGWYEWKEVERVDPSTGEIRKVKQPYFIHLPGRKPLSFAGIMSVRWADEQKTAKEYSCSIVTKEAEGPATEVHTRMPVILPKTAWNAWMDQKQMDAGKALEAARQVAVNAVDLYPVSTRVNVAKNQGVELLDPFENPA